MRRRRLTVVRRRTRARIFSIRFVFFDFRLYIERTCGGHCIFNRNIYLYIYIYNSLDNFTVNDHKSLNTLFSFRDFGYFFFFFFCFVQKPRIRYSPQSTNNKNTTLYRATLVIHTIVYGAYVPWRINAVTRGDYSPGPSA